MTEIDKLKKQLTRVEHMLETLTEEVDEIYNRLSELDLEDKTVTMDYTVDDAYNNGEDE